MAESYSHRFGQLIGDFLEVAIEGPLREFASKHHLYLDQKGIRRARNGKKLSWVDGNGNSHDLDFVLERNGSEELVGTPVAFIEIAWRRYTKHSRNKAQEIQGAILPLLFKYKNYSPFAGVVLAGEFTDGALRQLKSSGFTVAYFPYSSIVDALGRFDIDARFDETTPESEFKNRLAKVENLGSRLKDIPKEIARINKTQVQDFFYALSGAVLRKVDQIIILPLHGCEATLHSIDEAVDFITSYVGWEDRPAILRYEIIVKYSNGDKIDAIFNEKEDAVKFLKQQS